MQTPHQSLETLQDIKRIMERSSRFISLSGLSGISAGVCALAGAWIAVRKMVQFKNDHAGYYDKNGSHYSGLGQDWLVSQFIGIAAVVFVAALLSAFLFTYIRSKKAGVGIWSNAALRLMWNTMLPMIVGGFVILRLIGLRSYLLAAPCSLIFYGLGLVNGSKYTLGEVKYLGYAQIILGLINLWLPGYGLVFWATGFGVLHIIYGTLMWWKYER